MNQALLKRLFRSIPAESNSDLSKIAKEIIDEERKKGHESLANSLQSLLAKSETQASLKSFGKVISLHELPLDRRFKIPLVTYVERENLRHEMVLPEETSKKIRRIEEEYAARERLKHYGLNPRRKILLYGSPGCGKSMTAERIAWNLGLPFLKVKFEAILSSFLGESASNIKSIFDSVKNFPSVLLLDEFDFIGKSRNTKNDVGEMHRIVNILLQLMEEYDAPGILVATTNLEGSLDEALFRRFDDIIELPKPGISEIQEILKNSFSAITLDKKINWNKITKDLLGYSSAMVVKIAQDASKEAVIKQELPVGTKHITKAILENPRLEA
ncbi:ATP-binding protein [Leptospira bourretii]|uniref:ATP-binding protein n=1 Tax=Leptospira bourretii TaxID=2484962 RepID=A0A4R9IIH5_9LEPT|nr:AAA family ATPase [Leptospira bourretii]TGK88239.1 ATP-binding protein [Leptospira bourretii]TGK88889.1 ATP-binding protein [Leptospira bourretii]TGL37939.1 ATP-binding protein [Leptospira bourretii]